MPGQPVRVFISYSHDTPAHREQVLDLANRLRSEGVDAWIDRYESDPPEGWPRWMQQQLAQADFVICVCTDVYRRRFEGNEQPGRGKGVTWEGLLATQLLYDAGARNERLVPVLLDGASEAALPQALSPYTFYRVPGDYDGLYRRLTGQPAVVAPPLGALRVLAPHGNAGPARPAAAHPGLVAPLAPRSEGLPGESVLARLWGVPALPPHHVQRSALAEILASLASEGTTRVGIAALAGTGAGQPTSQATNHAPGKHGLHGMGGIGKTVLAAAVARSPEVRQRFADGVYWLTLGQEPQLATLQAQLGRALGQGAAFDTLQEGKQRLAEHLAGRAVLLVLDDVWDVQHAAMLDVVGERGRLLVTTRDRQVLAGLGAAEHCLDVLPREQALALLADWAGQDAAGLPADAGAVAEKCGRLPLALAMLGAMVRAGVADWADALELLAHAELAGIAQRFPDYPYPDLLRAIEVSVEALEAETRERYLDLAVFPEDQAIPESALEILWSVHGPSRKARRFMGILVARSLASRDAEGQLRLHDLQRMYVRMRAGNLAMRHSQLVAAYAAQCRGSLARGPEAPVRYFLEWLPYHLAEAGQRDELQRLLGDYDWLDAKLRAFGPIALLTDFELLRSDDAALAQLGLVRDALRLSSHVLARDPDQLPGQLVGRLGEPDHGAPGQSLIARLLEQARTESRFAWLSPAPGSLASPRGPLLFTLSGHVSAVYAVAVTSDGRRAISASRDGTLKVWNLGTGQEERTLSGHTDWVHGVAVTPDGLRAISASMDRTLKVWNLVTGQEEQTLIGHIAAILAVVVTPDGRRAISASDDRTLKVWDLATGQEERTLMGHAGRILAVAVTPNGRRVISASRDRTLKIWNLATGQEEGELTGHVDMVLAVAVTPDGKRAISASADRMLKIWNLVTREEEGTLAGHVDSVLAVVVTPDGKQAISASADQTLKVWDLIMAQEVRTLSGIAGWINAMAVTADGRKLISASTDRTLKVWNLAKEQELRRLMGNTDRVGYADRILAAVVTPDGRRAITAFEDWSLKVWDLETGQAERTLSGHVDRNLAVAVTPDGRRAISGSDDRTLKVWNLATGEVEHTLSGHAAGIIAVAVTPDSRRVISGSKDRTLRVWELAAGKEARTLMGHAGWVRAVAVTPDGRRIISVADDRTLKVWDLETGREEWTWAGHGGWSRPLAITPDSRQVISFSDERMLKVWDLETGREAYTLPIHEGWGRILAMMPDGKRAIFTSDGGSLKLWNLATGQQELTLAGHTGWVQAVSIRSNGKRAVSVSDDGTLRVWELESGRMVATFTGEAAMLDCVVTQQGDRIMAGDRDGRVYFLRLIEPH